MPTKTFNHAVTIYKVLESKSRQATEGRVFEGSLRQIFVDSEDVPFEYYQRVRDLLGNLGCIRYLRTGHGKTESLIQLNQAPTIELYNEFKLDNKGPNRRAHNEVVMGRINDVVRRMDALERDMRTLMGVVREALGQGIMSDDN